MTGYIDLPQDKQATLIGMAPSAAIKGRIAWTKDTEHCRVAVGVKVSDAKKIARQFGGHHIALAFGDWIEEIQMLGDLLA